MSDHTHHKERKAEELEYCTIRQKQWHQATIEKSEFIACAAPIEEEKEINFIFNEIRQKYPAAAHYVYAFTVGAKQEIQQYDDDGEPSGTGGMPILEIFRNKKLCYLMVVVVRYFGGIKLGTGGLKRAYSRTALKAIEEAGIINMKLHQWIHLKIDYSHWGKIEHYLTQHHIPTDKLVFTDMVSFNIPLLPCDEQTVLAKVAEIVGGVPIMEKLEREYLASLNTD